MDWDDLCLGDPALDIAMLLWSPTADGLPPHEHVLPDDLATNEPLVERMAVYRRAQLLYWTVDGIADYMEAESVPEQASAIRAEKEIVYERLLALYFTQYAADHLPPARP